MLDKVINVICDFQNIDKKGVSSDSLLINDIGLTSMDLMILCSKFEEELGIEFEVEDIYGIKTIGDIVKYIEENS